MHDEAKQRCVNIDWLEIYALESTDRYPCNAEYFRRHGYMVRERAFGTRVYKEMFEILNDDNQPMIEIRRNPASGEGDFNGLVPQSTHIRLPNWILYQNNPVEMLSGFLLQHDYIFKRIFRIDICYDFVRFDTGDKPAKFVKRYLEGKFRKINQCSLTAHGEDNWNACNWNSLSWGARTSMVSTKLYNKTKELAEGKTDKPYIKTCWMMAGLIDNPTRCTKYNPDGTEEKVEVWRLEFSLRSACDGWIVYEWQGGKKMKKQHLPHRLPMFDAKDKLWQRFQDLCYHYFRFKYLEYADGDTTLSDEELLRVHSDPSRPLKRKDRCRDKKLFYFDTDREFTTLTQAPHDAKQSRDDEILEKRLIRYRMLHPHPEVIQAVNLLLSKIDLTRLTNYSPKENLAEAKALQLTLARKMGGDTRSVAIILDDILKEINQNDIF